MATCYVNSQMALTVMLSLNGNLRYLKYFKCELVINNLNKTKFIYFEHMIKVSISGNLRVNLVELWPWTMLDVKGRISF